MFLMFSCSPIRQTARVGSTNNSKELVDKDGEKLKNSIIYDSTNNTEKIIDDKQKQIGDTLMIQLPDVEQSNTISERTFKEENPAGSKVDDGDNESIKKRIKLCHRYI